MQKPPRPTGTSRGKRAELAGWIEQASPARIGEAEFRELHGVLAPISESYLRKLLRDSCVPLAPMVEGVRQGSFDELETSLYRLLEEYEAGGGERRAAVRRLVITAKDHTRWAAGRYEKGSEKSPEKRAVKDEMVLWLVTWLENPPVFREWVKLRRAQLSSSQELGTGLRQTGPFS